LISLGLLQVLIYPHSSPIEEKLLRTRCAARERIVLPIITFEPRLAEVEGIRLKQRDYKVMFRDILVRIFYNLFKIIDTGDRLGFGIEGVIDRVANHRPIND